MTEALSLNPVDLVSQSLGQTEILQVLTPREREVFELKWQGHTNAEIASTLCCAEGTIKIHVRNIRAKLGPQYDQLIATYQDEAYGDSNVYLLTRREQEIFDLKQQGLTNAEIAERLVCEVGTIKNYVHFIREKLGAEYDALMEIGTLERIIYVQIPFEPSDDPGLSDRSEDLGYVIAPLDPHRVLSPTEYEIFKLFGDDISQDKIVKEFGCVGSTARVFISRIYARLNAPNPYTLYRLHAFYVENDLFT